MKVLKKILIVVMLLALFSVVIWCAGLLYFKSSIVTEGTLIDRQTDAIVVLTGGSDRLKESLMLLENNMAGRLFVSGAGKGVTVQDLLNAAEGNDSSGKKRYSIVDRVEIGYAAHDTIGNAQEVAQWIKQKGYRSFRLVTSNYHMIRSLLELRHVISEDVFIVPHPVVSSNVHVDEWLDYKGSRELIIREYNKVLMAWLYIQYQNFVGQ